MEHTRDAGTEKILGRRIPSDKCRSCSAGITNSLQNQLVLSSNITSSRANFPSTTQTAAMFETTSGNILHHHPWHYTMPAKQNH